MSDGWTPSDLTEFVATRLAAAGDPVKAPQMAAYMKTDMPFHGVQKPGRVPIMRAMRRRFVPADRAAYEAAVVALWALPYREERYAALDFAAQARWVATASLPLYERLIREGAWWDLVDELIGRVVSPLTLAHPVVLWPIVDRWIDDEDLWIRRAAILSQLKHKDRTDPERLFRYCLRRAHDKEFFIRKAIGWALRQYSYAAPEAVRDFLLERRDQLSGLSLREGRRQLVRAGLWPEDT